MIIVYNFKLIYKLLICKLLLLKYTLVLFRVQNIKKVCFQNDYKFRDRIEHQI